MQENYKILKISKDATNEEVEVAYKALKEQYSKDRFLEGEVGNIAAKKLTMLENAYKEIMEERREKEAEIKSEYIGFSEIEELIRNNQLTQAQNALDSFNERNAEWHYIQSVIFYKKNWKNECKKQLEIAISMEPDNDKYKDALNRLVAQINYNQAQFNNAQTNQTTDNRNMGGGSGDCLSFCATWCCMDMLCSMCCR